jgi:quercetin dioxygenase-like cupin family protein
VHTHTLIFSNDDALDWQSVATGIQRKVMTYDDTVMLVKVKFDANAVGTLHQHYHAQITYIAAGSFEVEIEGHKKTLHTGDVFYASPNKWHGVVCKEAGMLIDFFSPYREDFINQR